MSFNSGMKGADVVALLKNGLPIVDSVDKLDANAALGSIACVVEAGSASEISFKDLYQPDASIFGATGNIDVSNCSQVSSIKITAPTAPIPLNGVSISGKQSLYFVSEGVSFGGNSSGKMATLAVMPNTALSHIEGALGIVTDFSNPVDQQYVLWTMSDDGVITANQEQIDAFCSAAEGLFYAGDLMSLIMGAGTTSIEYLNFFDHFAKAVTGVPSKAYIYHKKDSWEELYKNDFVRLKQEIGTKANRISCVLNSLVQTVLPNVYYGLTIGTGENIITLVTPDDAGAYYDKYIFEVKCGVTPSRVSFVDENGTELAIKWPNDIAPAFEAGYIYVIQIANGFGVYSTFTNE